MKAFDYDPDWPPERVGRLKYTPRDDNLIIEYLKATKDILHLNGNEVWKKLAQSRTYNVTGYSWQSLREHFQKKMLPSLEASGRDDALAEWLTHRPPGSLKLEREGRAEKSVVKTGREIVVRRPRPSDNRVIETEENTPPPTQMRKRRIHRSESPDPLGESIADSDRTFPTQLQRAVSREVTNSFRIQHGLNRAICSSDDLDEITPDFNPDKRSTMLLGSQERLPDLIDTPQSSFRQNSKESTLSADQYRVKEEPQDESPDAISVNEPVSSQSLLRQAVADTQEDTPIRKSKRQSKRRNADSWYEDYSSRVQRQKNTQDLDQMIYGGFAPSGNDSDSNNLVIDMDTSSRGKKKGRSQSKQPRSQEPKTKRSRPKNSSRKRSIDEEEIPPVKREPVESDDENEHSIWAIESVRSTASPIQSIECHAEVISRAVTFSVTKKFILEVPEIPGLEGNSKLVALNLGNSFISFLKKHTDMDPHVGCVGLREYISLWKELHKRITKFSDEQHCPVLKDWYSKTINEQVSAMLTVPICCPKVMERISAENSYRLFEHGAWVDFVREVAEIDLS